LFLLFPCFLSLSSFYYIERIPNLDLISVSLLILQLQIMIFLVHCLTSVINL